MGEWQTRTPVQQQQHPRVRAEVSLRVSTVDPEVDPDTRESFYRSAEETTADLSRGGAFVRSWEPLEAGRRVVLEIELPEIGRVELLGQVVWTRRALQPAGAGSVTAPGFGVRFVEMGRFQARLLDLFLMRAGIPPRPAPAADGSEGSQTARSDRSDPPTAAP